MNKTDMHISSCTYNLEGEKVIIQDNGGNLEFLLKARQGRL